jgi:O-methyltransferase
MDKTTFTNIVKPNTMTTEERIHSLFDSLEYIRKNNIDGDLVECGVWKGGNILGIISYLHFYGIYRNVWLYDTFDGMINPSEHDLDHNGSLPYEWVGKCKSDLDYVKGILKVCDYPENMIKFVKGDICLTLEDDINIPKKISLLRLDTDWYESTKKEMQILYPKLVNNGILIVDDYGHWQGCKLAIDEYVKQHNINFDKIHIDYTCIKYIKNDGN